MGNIGTFLAQGIIDHDLPYKLTFANEVDEQRANEFCKRFPEHSVQLTDLDTLAARSKVIVEAAHPSVVPVIAQKALLAAQQVEATKYLFVMSVGGLLQLSEEFYRDLSGSYFKIIAPSGAIGGLDAFSSMTLESVDYVRLTTRKPPEALGRKDKEVTEIYRGAPKPAFEKFPKNVNVSITLGLATVGLDKMEFVLVSDPNLTQNIHEIEASGAAGNVHIVLKNVPSPSNPRTSYIAALSIISALRRFSQNLLVGY